MQAYVFKVSIPIKCCCCDGGLFRAVKFLNTVKSGRIRIDKIQNLSMLCQTWGIWSITTLLFHGPHLSTYFYSARSQALQVFEMMIFHFNYLVSTISLILLYIRSRRFKNIYPIVHYEISFILLSIFYIG